MLTGTTVEVKGDIEEENKRYALELADCVNTSIEYIVEEEIALIN